jgi:hypothetical protein
MSATKDDVSRPLPRLRLRTLHPLGWGAGAGSEARALLARGLAARKRAEARFVARVSAFLFHSFHTYYARTV